MGRPPKEDLKTQVLRRIPDLPDRTPEVDQKSAQLTGPMKETCFWGVKVVARREKELL